MERKHRCAPEYQTVEIEKSGLHPVEQTGICTAEPHFAGDGMSMWSICWDKRGGLHGWVRCDQAVPEHGAGKCRWEMKCLVWAPWQHMAMRRVRAWQSTYVVQNSRHLPGTGGRSASDSSQRVC